MQQWPVKKVKAEQRWVNSKFLPLAPFLVAAGRRSSSPWLSPSAWFFLERSIFTRHLAFYKSSARISYNTLQPPACNKNCNPKYFTKIYLLVLYKADMTNFDAKLGFVVLQLCLVFLWQQINLVPDNKKTIKHWIRSKNDNTKDWCRVETVP